MIIGEEKNEREKRGEREGGGREEGEERKVLEEYQKHIWRESKKLSFQYKQWEREKEREGERERVVWKNFVKCKAYKQSNMIYRKQVKDS